MGDSFQGHALRLYLDKTLYKAFIRLQADKGLGPSFAGFLPFVEGLHMMGYLTDQECEEHIKRYSQPLCDGPKLPSYEERKEQEEIAKWDKNFSLAIKEWAALPEKSRQYYVSKATEWQDKVSNAKLVLSLANGSQRNDDKLEKALGHRP